MEEHNNIYNMTKSLSTTGYGGKKARYCVVEQGQHLMAACHSRTDSERGHHIMWCILSNQILEVCY